MSGKAARSPGLQRSRAALVSSPTETDRRVVTASSATADASYPSLRPSFRREVLHARSRRPRLTLNTLRSHAARSRQSTPNDHRRPHPRRPGRRSDNRLRSIAGSPPVARGPSVGSASTAEELLDRRGEYLQLRSTGGVKASSQWMLLRLNSMASLGVRSRSETQGQSILV